MNSCSLLGPIYLPFSRCLVREEGTLGLWEGVRRGIIVDMGCS